MAAIGQTIAIYNRSNKLVKSSRHISGIFQDAKLAYMDRKAELRSRQSQPAQRTNGRAERSTRQRLEVMTLDGNDEAGGSARSSRRNSEDDREYRGSRSQRHHRPSPLRDDSSLAFLHDDDHASRGELTRRHTDMSSQHSPSHYHQQHPPRPGTSVRSASADDVDMALAYGDLPPPLPYRSKNNLTEVELRTKMTALQALLIEAHCLSSSAGAIIANLQKNPDALAAVALTLAEISNLATKLAPGALMGLKGAFPAVLALLMSPEFAIAIGVGVGLTVVVLGGYKIVKKIQEKRDAKKLLLGVDGGIDDAEAVEELREISQIEHWRRGIENVPGALDGAGSVEGEFVTPLAAGTLIKEGRLRASDLKKMGRRSKSADMREELHGQGSHFGRSKSGVRVSEKEKASTRSGLGMLFASRGRP